MFRLAPYHSMHGANISDLPIRFISFSGRRSMSPDTQLEQLKSVTLRVVRVEVDVSYALRRVGELKADLRYFQDRLDRIWLNSLERDLQNFRVRFGTTRQ